MDLVDTNTHKDFNLKDKKKSVCPEINYGMDNAISRIETVIIHVLIASVTMNCNRANCKGAKTCNPVV
jgi:hypothetical protein